MRVKLRRSPSVAVVHQPEMSLLKGGGQALIMACRRRKFYSDFNTVCLLCLSCCLLLV